MKAGAKNVAGGLEKALEQCGYAIFVPEGNSMLPLLRPDRDCVVVEACREYDIYDVVLFRRKNGHYILHRIVGRDGAGYILCADHQYTLEHGIAASQILGKMSRWEHGKRVRTPEDAAYKIYITVWCRTFFLRKLAFFAERCWKKSKGFFAYPRYGVSPNRIMKDEK